MRTEDIIKAREQAEKAVTGMLEGPMKAKAFEVILSRLLDGLTSKSTSAGGMKDLEVRGRPRIREVDVTSVPGRILVLRDDGFFAEQRSISDIQSALRVRGWHYPLTTLSGRLVELVQRGMLRRELVRDGSKKIWKYSNP